jgi:small-conductance mechanosensitive channel
MDFSGFLINKLMNPGTYSGALALALVMIVAAWAVCAITTYLLNRPIWGMGSIKRKIDKTIAHYLVRAKNLLIFVTAFFIYASLVPGLKALLGTLVAGAGITAILAGFAAKSTIANLVAGIAITTYRPIRIGDKVSIDGNYSTVEDITLRHTIVRTLQYERVIIPNTQFDEMTLTNYSIIDPRMLCIVELGVSYDTDIDLTRRLILEEASDCPYRDSNADEPLVRVISHGDFSIGLRVYLWVPNSEDARFAKFWLLENIKKRFNKEAVEIPFPYRTLVYKKDLPPPITSPL